MPRLHGAVLFLMSSFVCAAALSAQQVEEAQPLDDSRAAVIVRVEGEGQREDASSFAEAFAAALLREAQSAGYTASREDFPSSEVEGPRSEASLALEAAADTGLRWIMIARLRLEESRLVWRVAVYDGASGALLGADSFSAYAGISAFPLIDDSVRAAVASAQDSITHGAADIPVHHPLVFASEDEGAVVRIGDVLLGEVSEGRVTAPYIPFADDRAITVGITKDGYWERMQTISVSDSETEIPLKALFVKAQSAYGFNYGTARILGAAAGYRKYIVPDQIYLRAEASIWATYDFSPAASPVLHDELRFGLGAYLFFNPNARFRSSVGIGMSSIGTLLTARDAEPRVGIDVCVEPLFFTLEWHWPSWALVFESRFPYSLGAGSGFLKQGWLTLADAGPQFYSIGIVFKR